MQQYYAYTTEQFVWDDFFRTWVLTPTAETDASWQQWLADHPKKTAQVQQARELVLALQVKQIPLSAGEIEDAIRQIVDTAIEKPLYSQSQNLFWQYSWRVAATLVLLAGLGWWFWTSQTSPNSTPNQVAQPERKLVERINQTNHSLMVSLSDGSVAVLQPNSRIQFPATFAPEKREVHLSGEAFFEVAHNPTRPFFVVTNELVTKVLGTSFSIRAFTNEANVSVKVRTGRVAVFARESPSTSVSLTAEPIIVKAKQQIAYSREKAQLTKSAFSESAQSDGTLISRRFQFDDAPLPQVLETLEKAYGVTIVYDRNQLKNCPLTARFADQSLYEMLQFICTALDGNYVVQNGQIMLEAHGCTQ